MIVFVVAMVRMICRAAWVPMHAGETIPCLQSHALRPRYHYESMYRHLLHKVSRGRDQGMAVSTRKSMIANLASPANTCAASNAC